MFPEWTSMLTGWQWAAFGLVPPAIVALYFLKLKRQPLEVPSTYLWRKSIEDLHVNSLWQRLRKNLLLWLQLLIVLLLALALLNPSWEGQALTGSRFLFLIDNSASMQTRDAVDPTDATERITRLEEAQRRVATMIDAMKMGDSAMIISFSDTARVVQEYTTNPAQLRRRLESIVPTDHRTSLVGALQLASGLANPGRTGDSDNADDAAAAEALPAEMFVFSDFKLPDVADFALGHLDPQLEMVGTPGTPNVGIVAFTTRRDERRPDRIQVFARLGNYSPDDVTVTLELTLDGRPKEVKRVTLPGRREEQETTGDESESHDRSQAHFKQVVFTLEDTEMGVLHLTHDFEDAFAIDNEAWAVVNVPRRCHVLFASTGNAAFRTVLTTAKSSELADVTFCVPDALGSEEIRRKAMQGYYDLIIYDRCQPKEMPESNTLFVGALPPTDRWSRGAMIDAPQIIDTERTHPLMQLLDLGDVFIAEGFEVKPPAGGSMLIESHGGVLAAIGPRDEFEDVVLGFAFEGTNKMGETTFDTNWPLRPSFPVFMQETLQYLGGNRASQSTQSVAPGKPYELHLPTAPETLTVTRPDGSRDEVRRTRQNRYHVAHTDQVGVYTVQGRATAPHRIAVNLFDPLESEIEPVSGKAVVRIGNVDLDVRVKPTWDIERREIWKWLALLGLGVLVFEWYIYNRRVYV